MDKLSVRPITRWNAFHVNQGNSKTIGRLHVVHSSNYIIISNSTITELSIVCYAE